MNNRTNKGFTLLEVMLVVVILSMLAFIALPRLTASSEVAREKADITTGREVKAALDRFQIEKGNYPRLGEMLSTQGKITCQGFIPDYVIRLDPTVTQQNAADMNKGFGIKQFDKDTIDSNPSNVVMIYLTTDGSVAQVVVYHKSLSQVLWSSY